MSKAKGWHTPAQLDDGRYGDFRKKRPQHLPSEIHAVIQGNFIPALDFADMCSLGRVNKSFEYEVEYLKEGIGEKELEIYLDEEGLDEIENLIKHTDLAQYVKRVSVGIRRVQHHSVLIQEKDRQYFDKNGQPHEGLTDEEGQAFAHRLQVAMSNGKCRWTSIADAVEGFEVKTGPTGCELFERDHDFRPSSNIMKRFARLIQQFPNLEALRENEDVKHGVVIVKGFNGSEFGRFVVKDRDSTLPHPRKQAYCVHATARIEGRACKNVGSMKRCLIADWATKPMKAVPNKGSFVLNPRSLSWVFPSKGRAASRTATDEQHNLCTFLWKCEALSHLRLWISEPNSFHSGGEPITYILGRLSGEAWAPPIKVLELSSVDPMSDEIMSTMNGLKPTLKYLHVENPCRSVPVECKAGAVLVSSEGYGRIEPLYARFPQRGHARTYAQSHVQYTGFASFRESCSAVA